MGQQSERISASQGSFPDRFARGLVQTKRCLPVAGHAGLKATSAASNTRPLLAMRQQSEQIWASKASVLRRCARGLVQTEHRLPVAAMRDSMGPLFCCLKPQQPQQQWHSNRNEFWPHRTRSWSVWHAVWCERREGEGGDGGRNKLGVASANAWDAHEGRCGRSGRLPPSLSLSLSPAPCLC